MTANELLIEQRESVLSLTFNRPDRLNASTQVMDQALLTALEQAKHSGDVKVIVFRGATGKRPSFMAGADLDGFDEVNSREGVITVEAESERVLRAIEEVGIPTIAAIDGPAVGQGALISSCCDFLVCGPSTKFGFPIARTVGNALSARNLLRLIRLVGEPMVRQMLMRARLLTGDELLHAGATMDSFDSVKAFEDGVERLTDEISALAPLTLQGTKTVLHRISDLSAIPEDIDVLERTYLSQDSKEAMAAFRDRRPPRWTGR